ncbi:hypothetical protein COBT_000805, partial [Conglomerata obtusa]
FKSIKEFYEKDQVCCETSKTIIKAINDASKKENKKNILSAIRSGEQFNKNLNDEVGMELVVTELKSDVLVKSHISSIVKSIDKSCQNNIQLSIGNTHHTNKTEEEIKNKNDHMQKHRDAYLKIRKTTKTNQKEYVSKKLPHSSVLNRSDQKIGLKRIITLSADKRGDDKQNISKAKNIFSLKYSEVDEMTHINEKNATAVIVPASFYIYFNAMGIKNLSKNNSNLDLISNINGILDHIIASNSKLRKLVCFLIVRIVELCIISHDKNVYIPTQSKTFENNLRRNNSPKDNLDDSEKKQLMISIDEKSFSSTKKVSIAKNLNDDMNKMRLLNLTNITESKCELYLCINKFKSSSLQCLLKYIFYCASNKENIYCINQTYWVFESKYIEYILFNYDSFMADSSTKKAFGCENILRKIF